MPLIHRHTTDMEVCVRCGARATDACRNDYYGDHEVISLSELPDLRRELDETERRALSAERQVKALEKTKKHMADALAIITRWGTGVNLQASYARGVLEREGYALDARGWMDGDSAYDPAAPPWGDR